MLCSSSPCGAPINEAHVVTLYFCCAYTGFVPSLFAHVYFCIMFLISCSCYLATLLKNCFLTLDSANLLLCSAIFLLVFCLNSVGIYLDFALFVFCLLCFLNFLLNLLLASHHLCFAFGSKLIHDKHTLPLKIERCFTQFSKGCSF